MKILYHHRTRGEDAQGVHIAALCEAFEQLGHEIKVVALVTHNNGQKQTEPASVRQQGNSLFNFTIPHWLYECLALAYNIAAFFVLTFWVLRFRPDFIYERYSIFTISGLLAAKLFRLPFILEVNAPLSVEMKTFEKLAFQRLAQRLEDWLCLHATRTVVVSKAMREIFQQRGLPGQKFMIVPNGVDSRHFHPQVNGESLRDALSLQNKFVVGFVGWMRPWHGVDVLIEAVARLQNKIPALNLLLVGDGPAVPDLQKQIQQLDLTDKIHITGPVPQEAIPRYIAVMDVAVQPDVTAYASPIKLFEYLAMGKAVIAPRKENIIEIVEDGKQALLYAARDAGELAQKISQLYHEQQLRKRLETAALQLVQARGFYWQANAARIIETVTQNGKAR